MSGAALRIALRLAAISIAVAALIDPVFSIGSPAPPPVVVVTLTANDSPEWAGRLRQALGGAELTVRQATNHRVPCAPGEPCVVVADGSVEADVPSDLRPPIALLTLPRPAAPNLALRDLSIVTAQHAGAAGAAAVVLEGTGVAGRRVEVRLTDGDIVVGSASHEWKADGEATVTVPWWPIAGGPRTIRAYAVPVEGETASFDNAIDAGVVITTERLPILVFDPRPSWASTFVRRALEDDPRFIVDYRTAVAPAISAGTTSGRLDEQALDAAGAVVVGAVEALSAAEVSLVERYVRVRGGTAILLPDRAPSGPAARLFGSGWRERLAASAETIGPLRASEILSTSDVPVTAAVLGRAGNAAAIVASPTGAGRIVIAGAMDPWRFRDDGAFDKFWRSLAAEAAAAGAALKVEFETGIAATGTRRSFSVRHRRMSGTSPRAAAAVARCEGGEARPIRLWPAGEPGVFTGEVAAGAAASCTIDVTVDGQVATAGLAIARAPQRGTTRTLNALARDVRRLGGVIADERDLSPIATRLTRMSAAGREAAASRPMQSAWWILPFAGCLSLEWWLRRRIGLR